MCSTRPADIHKGVCRYIYVSNLHREYTQRSLQVYICVQFTRGYTQRSLQAVPHLLGDGFWTPVPLFCLICTIISNKTGLFDQYQNTPQVLAARSFLVAGFDTHVIPRSFSCGVTESPKIYRCIYINFKMSFRTHIAALHRMGWLRLVGSLKLQVSFAKEPYKRDDILPKRPIILRRLLIVATP